MPDNREQLEIEIKTTATGDGAKKTADLLKDLNKETEKLGETTKKAGGFLADAEKAIADMGTTAPQAAAGVGALAAGAGAGGAALGLLHEGIAGLSKLAPSLGTSLQSIGSGIRGAFQEVLGGALQRGLTTLFGPDFEARLQKIAEAFGGVSAKMHEMQSASAEYLATHKSLAELLQREEDTLQRITTHRHNLAELDQKQIEANQKIDEINRAHEKAVIERDPKLEFQPGEKARRQDVEDDINEMPKRWDEDEKRAIALKKFEDDAMEAAREAVARRAEARAANAMAGRDNSRAGDLPPDKRQEVMDKITAVNNATPSQTDEAIKKLAEHLKELDTAAEKAAKKVAEAAEAFDKARKADEIDQQLIEKRRNEADIERERLKPQRETAYDIANEKGDLASSQKYDKDKVGQLADEVRQVESDPAFAADTNGKVTAALESALAQLTAKPEDENAQIQLATVLESVKSKLSQTNQQSVELSQRIIDLLKGQADKQQMMLQNIKELQQRLDLQKADADTWR